MIQEKLTLKLCILARVRTCTSVSFIFFPISSVPSSFLIARFMSSSRANSTILQKEIKLIPWSKNDESLQARVLAACFNHTKIL